MRTKETSEQNPGKILDHGAGIGEADNDLVEQRARELARIAGLPTDGVTDAHRWQARQELSGRSEPNTPNDDTGPAADLTGEDDVPGESGGATPPATNSAASDDEETIGAALYAEGVQEATHDQMTESRKRDRQAEG